MLEVVRRALIEVQTMVIVCLVCLVLYVLGIPIAGVILLHKKRGRIKVRDRRFTFYVLLYILAYSSA